MLKLLHFWREPSAEEIKNKMKEAYERSLVVHEDKIVYHQKMSEYYKERLERLNAGGV